MAKDSRIAAAREARGWTQRQLAAAAGVDRRAVMAMEHGTYAGPFADVALVLDVLGLLIDLGRGTGKPAGRPVVLRGRYTSTEVSQVSIDNAKLGVPEELTVIERALAVDELRKAGLKDAAIAHRLHISRRTVVRYNARNRQSTKEEVA